MFIAMNRFRVTRGREAEFETLWRARPSHIATVPGFVRFDLLRGTGQEDHTLFASHTVWESRAAFEAWTKSDAFRAAHSGAASGKELTLGHPIFEGFETVADLQVASAGKAA